MSTNPARALAAETFNATLDHFYEKPGVTERIFADHWFNMMASHRSCSAEGWYVPPPNGLTVLTGPAKSDSRINFGSLREPQNWPSSEVVDWKDGCLYAYCSPVDRESGLPGDFAITLYFGNSDMVLQHFRQASAVTNEVLSMVDGSKTSKAIFDAANSIFDKASLRNDVISVTDTTPLDLGHSLPLAPQFDVTARSLDEAGRKAISKRRKFLNAVSDWRLGDERQITIEPQLRSTVNAELPQVTFHYVINLEPLTVMREPDDILSKFGLMP